ncbi:MAG: Do family serine endopeptidase [Sedimentisphaerales bacterium]|nr:Do family serine endopeptidase [Sedimentisphaerales bacterium]
MMRTALKHTSCIIVSTILLLLFCPAAASAQDEQSIAALRQMGKAFASIAEKASPAVVAIRAERTVTQQYQGYGDSPYGSPFDPFSDDFFDFFFRRRSPSPSPRQRTPQRKQTTTAQGTGFIISPDGYILTNNHLVGEAEKVIVELGDGRKFTAEKTGTDEDSDVAVVKIDANNLQYLKMADSDKLEVGEWVLAIGNPLGLSHTVTAGIVSAKGRSGFGLATLENFIQTDAAINFGNSGGPLINLDAEVVGMNTAIVGASGNIGIGFAIPINMAKNIYEQLKTGKPVERGFLGVLPQDMDADMAKAFGLKDNKGVLIPQVEEGSAADKAGIKHNDVVLKFNGQPVESANDFRNKIALLSPGTKVKIVIWRDGAEQTVTAELDKRDAAAAAAGGQGASDALNEFGFTVQNLTEELAKKYGFEGLAGVVVASVEPDSQADRASIVEGMLIREVNQVQVNNTKEFSEAIKQAKEKGTALLLVKHDVYSFYVLLTF